MERSWRSGRLQELRNVDTIADGLAVTAPYPEAVSDLTGLVDDIVLVKDTAILQAMRSAHQDLGIVLEPSGAASLAGLMTYRDRFQGQLVAVILSGGNLTVEQIGQWLFPQH